VPDEVYHLGMDEFTNKPGGHVYTPSELNQEVRLHLEAGFPRVLLEAEISNLSRPASGHLYFSLKDESAQIRCAMFRSAAARCSLIPENGKKVLARGRISLYESRGEYQFIVDGLRDAGEGLLQQLFEQLKKKLDAEGLFSTERKKPLPPFPLRIGVITSPSGAAIRDILQVLERRWPVATVRIYPVPVQGAEAPAAIRTALATAGRERWADILILARGGGSLEDLQAFNEESVARAVAASLLPVICAVGHETDFSICDFVADLRAPTPSAAAELAVPDRLQLGNSLSRHASAFNRLLRDRLQRDMQHLDFLTHRLLQRDPVLRLSEQREQLKKLDAGLQRAARSSLRQLRAHVDGVHARLQVQQPGKKLREYRERLKQFERNAERLIRHRLETSVDRVRILGRTLHAVSPLATLGRGYAVLSVTDSNSVISSVGQTGRGDKLTAQLANGRLYCTVDSVSEGAPLYGQLPENPGKP